jgi:hypothetical protein
MSDPHLVDLWRRHLDGPPLTPEERGQLADALGADAALRADCLHERRLHEQLSASVRLSDSDPAFVATVMRQCAYVGGSERFAKRVVRRLPRTSARRTSIARWWPLLAAGLLLVVLLVVGLPRRPVLGDWTVVSVAGGVRTVEGRSVQVGERILAGTLLHLAGGDRLRLDGGGEMTVDLHAAQVLVPALKDPIWRLGGGTLSAEIATRTGRPPVRIITPHATVEVIGTRFTVTVDTGTRLAVEHGRVRFGNAGAWREVTAGEQAEAPATAPPVAPPVSQPSDNDPRTDIASLLAYYLFANGAGAQVDAQAGRGPVLRIADPTRVTWRADGLRLDTETRLLSANAATSITDACIAANAVSIEAELTIDAVPPFTTATTGPARIVTLSQDSEQRNVTLGWGEIGLAQPALVLRLRQGAGAGAHNGVPAHWIPAPPPGRVHLLVTYQAGVGARWYVDGKEVPSQTWDYQRKRAVDARGPLTGWSRAARLALGGEVLPDARDGGLRPWLGTYHLVAIYGSAIDPATALQLTAP